MYEILASISYYKIVRYILLNFMNNYVNNMEIVRKKRRFAHCVYLELYLPTLAELKFVC